MRILAIGAHIGDAELMAGPLLCEASLRGDNCFMLALTPGELGNPQVTAEVYKKQKMLEAEEFSRKSKIPYAVFDDIRDSNLIQDSPVVDRVKAHIVDLNIDSVLTHWRGSFHPDHRQAHEIVSRAVLQLNVERRSTPKIQLGYCENWEDMEAFLPNEPHPISEKALNLWADSIEHEEFIYGTFSKFRYFDYYKALMVTRGCLFGFDRAVVTMNEVSI